MVYSYLSCREACVDFKELYKQKHTDGQWMDEVAAMKACSPAELSYLGNQGVILAYDNSGSLDSSDSKESTNSNGVRGILSILSSADFLLLDLSLAGC